MISVIICSRNATQLELVKKNIAATIGIPFEILSVDNSQNKYPICTAYNTAATEAKFETLCFMHEDVMIKTKDWGKLVLDAFNSGFGLIGVAGSKYKSKFISGWTTGNTVYDFYNVYHGPDNETASHYCSNNFDTALVECVVLDGLWLCCGRNIWDRIRFNSALLSGFHFYDIDFSIRCSRITRVAVTNRIDIVHRSSGKFDNNWLQAAVIFHKHYKNNLPLAAGIESVEVEATEKAVYEFWNRRLQSESISFLNRLRLQWYAYTYMPKFVLQKILKRSL